MTREVLTALKALQPEQVLCTGIPSDLLKELRKDFPMLSLKHGDQPYVYFNNAATALKPLSVLKAMDTYYREYGVNVFRGVDSLGYRATEAYESCHVRVEQFLDAPPSSVVLTRGTTSALNLIALSMERTPERFGLLPGRQLISAVSEHHANYLPWQQLAKRLGLDFCLAEVDENAVVQPAVLAELLKRPTALVAFNHVGNVLGGTQPIPDLIRLTHEAGALFVCDGAQGIVHERPSMRRWDPDFYAFSGHKLYGPTGIGCLYGRPELLEKMEPVEYGGEMIDTVGLYDMTPASPPTRFEAGTPMVAEAVGLTAALDYVEALPNAVLQAHKAFLGRRLDQGLRQIEDIQVYGEQGWQHGIVAFNVRGAHAHDIASVFDRAGIALRAGQHCAQPLMDHLACVATLRASISFYNSVAEVDRFLEVASHTKGYLDIFF